MQRATTSVLISVLALAACGGDDTRRDAATPLPAGTETAVGESDVADQADGSPLTLDSTWFWQLQGSPAPPYLDDVYDLDLFETAPSTVSSIHDAGAIVICYFSAGSYEGWRPDAGSYAVTDLGQHAGRVRGRTLARRALRHRPGAWSSAVSTVPWSSGVDGVEPDNMTAYTNDSGVEVTAADQLDFNRFVAREAARRGTSSSA